jgi:NADH:ubiquinone oxidoreductase subunit E
MAEIKQEKMEELRTFIMACLQKEAPDSYLIAVMHKAQELFGYLSVEVMDEVAQKMNIPSAHIWGVATFYHYFNLKPIGKYVISVCLGTACYVKGATEVLEAIKRELGVEIGQTTADNLFTLHEARCLGACGIAPVIMINDKIYGELDAKKVVALINQYRKTPQVA